jgi:hypothetical protein
MDKRPAKDRVARKRRAGTPETRIRPQKAILTSGIRSQTGASLSEIMDFVRWYNLRRYASRTFISKIANLPDLRDAFD